MTEMTLRIECNRSNGKERVSLRFRSRHRKRECTDDVIVMENVVYLLAKAINFARWIQERRYRREHTRSFAAIQLWWIDRMQRALLKGLVEEFPAYDKPKKRQMAELRSELTRDPYHTEDLGELPADWWVGPH